MNENIEIGSILVIGITFILFTLALFTKGFTHDLLLEAAVFLVSVKLILMAYRNKKANAKLLQEIYALKGYLENSKK